MEILWTAEEEKDLVGLFLIFHRFMHRRDVENGNVAFRLTRLLC